MNDPGQSVPDRGSSSAGLIPLPLEQKHFLLELARRTLERTASGLSLPPVEEAHLTEQLKERRSCFVTLFKAQALRGCIGNILATQPLYRAVIESAGGAASRDPRFPPVTPDEVPEIQIEISVLTELQPLPKGTHGDSLDRIVPGKHGVVLKLNDRFSTFLPQVWEHLPEKSLFLDKLSQKAGFGPTAWQEPQATLYLYETENFSEHGLETSRQN